MLKPKMDQRPVLDRAIVDDYGRRRITEAIAVLAAKALGTDYHDPAAGTEDFYAGAIVSVVARRVRWREIEGLASRRDELLRLAATPFLGLGGTACIDHRLEAA
jgi:hypothetical protein